jgi:hypothetical protein
MFHTSGVNAYCKAAVFSRSRNQNVIPLAPSESLVEVDLQAESEHSVKSPVSDTVLQKRISQPSAGSRLARVGKAMENSGLSWAGLGKVLESRGKQFEQMGVCGLSRDQRQEHSG